MAGCGYVCPQCEGKGFTDEGKECDYCIRDKENDAKQKEVDREDWIKKVHEGPCCSDQIDE